MTFEGVKGGVPFISLGIGCWYNKAAFKKAGIAGEPKSYAEMEEANEKLVSAGITPAGLGGKYGWDIMRLFEYLLGDLVWAGAARQAAYRRRRAGTGPEVVDCVHLTSRSGRTRSGCQTGPSASIPLISSPAYVQGKTAYTITGPWTEAAGDPNSKEGLRRLRCLPAADRPDAASTLRLRRGLHDQRQVR